MATVNPPKVLRIGIIVDGKIVQERLIKLGEAVTIGDNPKNTFPLKGLKLPKQDWPVFVYKGGKYHLNFTEVMKGKVGAGGSVAGLDKLRQDPSVEKDGNAWRLPLAESDRGKVSVGDVTVLFQFVSPPPTVNVKPPRLDFRARYVEEDDALLFVFLLVFGTGAAVLVLMAILFLPPEEEITSLDQLDEKWTKLLVDEPKEQPKPVDKPAETGETKAEEKPVEKAEVKEKVDTADKPVKTKAERVEAAKADVLKKSAVLQFLTTRGDSQGGTAKDLWSQGDVGAAAKALEGVSGVAAADEGNVGKLRGDAGGPGGNADIGDLGGIGGDQGVKVAEAPAVTLSVETGEGQADDMEEGDQAAIKKIVQKNAGQLKYCYETRLKANSDLSGRVEVTWNISGGRVTAAELFANTTGDAELAECIIGKVKRWTGFPPEAEGEVQWPFIFKQKS
jgi:hypothetical protein